MEYIIEFKDIHKEDEASAGEEGIEVANIVHAGCNVPEGFVISSQAFDLFFHENKLCEKISRLLEVFDIREGQNSLICAQRIKDLIESGLYPENIKKEIIDKYEEIGGLLHRARVNISSSYGGYRVGLEGISGEAVLLSKIRSLWASFFSSDRLLFSLDLRGDISRIHSAVVVWRMLAAQVKGIGFTKVKNEVELDFVLTEVKDEKSASEFSEKHKDEILRTLRFIDKHYFFPQQVDWVWSQDKVFVLSVRPSKYLLDRVVSDNSQGIKPILIGQGSGFGVATGVVRVIKTPKELIRVRRGEVVVTGEVTRDYFSVFGKVSALIAEAGEVLDHTSIISRELKLPMVTGAVSATKKLSDGMVVTVFGGSGEVYWGDGRRVNFAEEEVVKKTQATISATKIYTSFSTSSDFDLTYNIDGVCPLVSKLRRVGLGARAEGRILKLCEGVYPKSVIYQFSAHGQTFLKREADVVKRVRARFSNLWVSLPSVDSNEFLAAKRYLASLGLLRREDFKIFLTVRTPSAFFAIRSVLDFGVDGVIVDVRRLYNLFCGVDEDDKKVRRYQNDSAFGQLIESIVKECLDFSIPVIVYERNIYLYREFVYKLVGWGVSGISTRTSGVEKLRSVVCEAELRAVGGEMGDWISR